MSPRWHRRKERASHADDWLMTYADMITLLLCFFVIFLSVDVPKKDIPHHVVELPQPVVPPPEPQPVPPQILEGNLPFHTLSEYDDATDDAASDPVPVKTEITPVVSVPDAVKPADAPSRSLPEIVDNLKTQGPANIEQKGDRITTIQISSAAFFGSGSALLSEQGKSILQAVAVNLKSDEFKGYEITVEGHTDDTPISTAQFPSNWELSTARASAVVHFFLQQGLPAPKLRAAGYADTFPLAPNRDARGNAIPENQARNRRVVIKLEKIEKTG